MSSSTLSARDSGRLFEENILLKQKIGKVKRSIDDVSIVNVDDQDGSQRESKCRLCIKRWLLRPSAVFGLIAALFAVIAVYLLVSNFSAMSARLRDAVAANNKASALKTQGKDGLKTCTDGATAKAFPDLDYALFGYNILKGYPLAVGHDPGLTRPIFDSDYSKGRRTADCRYHLPEGLTVVPDISCVTSFTSEVIQDQYQLTRSLAASAEVSGGGWGAEFSASVEYKRNSAEVGSKETVYVYSQAKCDYYISMIDDMQPPSLSKSFLMKARLLNNTSDVYGFFDYYGTHYLKHVTFGARLIYENKMTKSSFKELSQSSISVAMSASYSGFVRIEGSASLSKEEAKQASQFRNKVETSTISVGAPPPPSGSTSQWASEVKENPVPTKYKMAGIEELFTEKFMKGTGIDYKRVFRLVDESKATYCNYLKEKGVVDSCKALQSYTKFKGLKLGQSQFRTINADERLCIKSCIEESRCVAVSHARGRCHLYGDGEHSAEQASDNLLVLFIDSINIKDRNLRILHVHLDASARAEDRTLSANQCKEKCRQDRKCIAYTSPLTGNRCKLYQQQAIMEDSMKFTSKFSRGGSFLEFYTNKTLGH